MQGGVVDAASGNALGYCGCSNVMSWGIVDAAWGNAMGYNGCRCWDKLGPFCWETRDAKGSQFKPGVGQYVTFCASSFDFTSYQPLEYIILTVSQHRSTYDSHPHHCHLHTLSDLYIWQCFNSSFLTGHKMYFVRRGFWQMAGHKIACANLVCLHSDFFPNIHGKQLSQTSSVNKARSLLFCLMKISSFFFDKKNG